MRRYGGTVGTCLVVEAFAKRSLVQGVPAKAPDASDFYTDEDTPAVQQTTGKTIYGIPHREGAFAEGLQHFDASAAKTFLSLASTPHPFSSTRILRSAHEPGMVEGREQEKGREIEGG